MNICRRCSSPSERQAPHPTRPAKIIKHKSNKGEGGEDRLLVIESRSSPAAIYMIGPLSPRSKEVELKDMQSIGEAFITGDKVPSFQGLPLKICLYILTNNALEIQWSKHLRIIDVYSSS